MTAKDYHLERLKRIVRVLEKYCEKGEYKYKGKRRRFIYKYSLTDRNQTKVQIKKIEDEILRLTKQTHQNNSEEIRNAA